MTLFVSSLFYEPKEACKRWALKAVNKQSKSSKLSPDSGVQACCWSKWYPAEEGSVLFKEDPSVHSGLQKTTLAVPFLTAS